MCDATPGSSAAEWFGRGMTLLAKQPAQAQACFADAAAADPTWDQPLDQLGEAQLRTGTLSSAAGHLRHAARLALAEGNRTAAAAHQRAVGEAYATKGKWTPAARAFAEAFRHAPVCRSGARIPG